MKDVDIQVNEKNIMKSRCFKKKKRWSLLKKYGMNSTMVTGALDVQIVIATNFD